MRLDWPQAAMYCFNCYQGCPPILVRSEDEAKSLWMWSQEGTQQGCPLAMAMFGVATLPLVKSMRPIEPAAAGAAAAGGDPEGAIDVDDDDSSDAEGSGRASQREPKSPSGWLASGGATAR